MPRIVFEAGRTWSLDELPPRSIALDGAVQGPAIDTAHARYSFDHHGECVRHATAACCQQVFDALLVGLDPEGFTVFVNDVDADTVMSVWLLEHPGRVRNDRGGRVAKAVLSVGRHDALGPALGTPPELFRALAMRRGEGPTRAVLDARLEVLDRWWLDDELPELPEPEPVLGIWLEGGRVVTGEVLGFAGLYDAAPFGVLAPAAPEGTRGYSVAKRSELVDFDLPLFLALCNDREPGWGGATAVGGAPRHADGSRSRLPVEDVGKILQLAAARSDAAASKS